ncbi:MAG: glycosyltransferase family 4 protein [Candidatus Dormibacteraeota bacterium]|nr:glycosyltransferase family 4 protein [Candidatus Dormibacteraeota bacterium]
MARYASELLGGLLTVRPQNDYQLLAHRPLDEFHIPARGRLSRQWESPNFPVRLAWMQLLLPPWLPGAGFDVCHFTNYLAPLLSRVPTVVTFHDMSIYLEADGHPKKRVLVHRALMPIVARRAAAIITDTESARRDVIARLKVDPGRVHAVLLGTSPRFRVIEGGDALQDVARRLSLPPEFALFVGTLEPRKNLTRVVEAMHRLRTGGVTVPLLLAGGTGWKNESLMARIEELDMADSVRFLGHVAEEDLPALINLATVFVFPSLYEGFGLPILEAMACGVPVVTSRGGATGEVAGDAALTVAATDTAEIADGVGSVLADASLRQRLRDAGLRRAAGFSWETAARETAEIYDRVAAPNG